ncbi:olfactory receptor 6N1-like [Lithobates pipiens]
MLSNSKNIFFSDFKPATKMNMDNENGTTVNELFFLGFPGLGDFRVYLFILILSTYTVTMLLDIMIIILVSTRQSLHSPMYMFLQNFLFSEMCLVTFIVPNMLRIIWMDGATISVTGCITQSYLFVSSGSSECYLLTAMSYDRYLAICKPLHYNTIMDHTLQYFLVIVCWMLGFLLPLIPLSLLIMLKFCGYHVIDHYFCDLAPFVNIACSDTSALQIDIFVLTIPVVAVPFVLIIVSYLCICVAILRMPSIGSRKKAFSTCSNHLLVVGMFFGAALLNYFIPVKEHSVAINKMLSIIFTVVTPLFNPIIYNLRNQDMHAVIFTYIQWWK